MPIFEVRRYRTTKINITFFFGGEGEGNEVLSTVFSFFLKKSNTVWYKPEKLVLGAHFPHICGSIGPIVSKNNRVHPWVNPHQLCEFHENQFRMSLKFCLLCGNRYARRYSRFVQHVVPMFKEIYDNAVHISSVGKCNFKENTCTSMIEGSTSSVLERAVQAKIKKTNCFVENGIFSVSNRTKHPLPPPIYHTTKHRSTVEL